MTATLTMRDHPVLAVPPTESGIAHGLSREAYTSERVLALEFERIFSRHWTFVGFAHDIPASGDAFPVHVAGQPVFVIRSASGDISAFHNVCRHRGHPLVRTPCQGLKNLVCPYHAWTYGLDGTLLRTPHFGGYGEHVDPYVTKNFHLRAVRCETWHDWIFVDLGGEAPALEAHVAPIATRLGAVDFSQLQVLTKLDLGVVEANWKLLIENFIEPYHVPVVHSVSAGGQPLRDHFMILDEHCVGCGIDVSVDPEADEAGQRLDMSTRYLMAFPNFVFAWYLPDQLGVHLNVPEAVNRTRQYRVIYHIGDQAPTCEQTRQLATLWTQVHREDHEIVEQLQIGRGSSVMDDGGLLSAHWESSVRQFHRLVLDALV